MTKDPSGDRKRTLEVVVDSKTHLYASVRATIFKSLGTKQGRAAEGGSSGWVEKGWGGWMKTSLHPPYSCVRGRFIVLFCSSLCYYSMCFPSAFNRPSGLVRGSSLQMRGSSFFVTRQYGLPEAPFAFACVHLPHCHPEASLHFEYCVF